MFQILLTIKIKRNNHNGILKWHGFHYKIAHVSNFPYHIPINIGDTITTNSHSIIFPEGINIGKIQSVKKEEQGYYNVEISLFQDFNQLNFVYIIHSQETLEQLKLERQIPNE